VIGPSPRENPDASGALAQFQVTHSYEIVATDNAVPYIQSGLPSDCLRGSWIVSGDHDYADAGTLAFADSFGDSWAKRIRQAHKAKKTEREG